MKRVSTYALALSLAAAGATPASAQDYGGGQAPSSGQQFENNRNNRQAAPTPGEFNPGNLSDAVRAQAGAAQQALAGEAPDLAAIRTQLQGAQAAIANDDDRFLVGQLMLQLSVAMQRAGSSEADVRAVQRPGLQLAVDSNRLSPADAGRYWGFLGNFANAEQDYPTAIAAYENALRYDPGNADAQIQLALAQFRSGNAAAGYAAADAALNAAREQGTDIPPTWITVPLNEASRQGDAARVAHYGQQLVASASTPDIWRQVLLAYSAAGRFNDQQTLDMLRLIRATGAHDAQTYPEHANLALRRGLPGEAQSLIDEAGSQGISVSAEIRSEVQNRLSGDRASLAEGRRSAEAAATGTEALNTADAYASYGDTAEALALYRLAVEKGGIDNGTANLRLASVLASTGQTAQARSLLEGISGSREGLARFWLAWLDSQSGAAAPAATAESASAEETAE